MIVRPVERYTISASQQLEIFIDGLFFGLPGGDCLSSVENLESVQVMRAYFFGG